MSNLIQDNKFEEARARIRDFSLSGEQNPEFFQKFMKKSFVGEFNPAEYHISGREDRCYCWDPDVCVDSRNPLLLRYHGRPIAVSSFGIRTFSEEKGFQRSDLSNLTTDNDFPLIVQLQGQFSSGHYLEPLKWTNILVTLIEEWAKELGFQKCLGLPVKKNKNMCVTPENYQIYDLTFRKMGYQLWKDYWKKDLVAETK